MPGLAESISRVGEKTELLGGVIYPMTLTGKAHRYAVSYLTGFLGPLFPRHLIQVNESILVPGWKGHDAPRPDITNTFVFIEVSDTSYIRDRNYKTPLYANHGLPAYIANIPDGWVEYYPDPSSLDCPTAKSSAGERFKIMGIDIDPAELFEPKA